MIGTANQTTHQSQAACTQLAQAKWTTEPTLSIHQWPVDVTTFKYLTALPKWRLQFHDTRWLQQPRDIIKTPMHIVRLGMERLALTDDVLLLLLTCCPLLSHGYFSNLNLQSDYSHWTVDWVKMLLAYPPHPHHKEQYQRLPHPRKKSYAVCESDYHHTVMLFPPRVELSGPQVSMALATHVLRDHACRCPGVHGGPCSMYLVTLSTWAMHVPLSHPPQCM